MQNIRYNPLFGTGDASSDAVSPVFGITRSNPLYGLNARSNGDTPDLIAIQGLGELWARVVGASNFSVFEANAEFDKLSSFSQDAIVEELNDIQDALNAVDFGSAEMKITALGMALKNYFQGEMEPVEEEEELVGPPREAMGDEEELVGPPREAMGDEEELVGPPRSAIGSSAFHEFITDQGLEPSFNMMNLLLGNEGQHLSPEMFDIAYDMEISELSTLIEGLELVMNTEASEFADILQGTADFKESALRLEGLGIACDAAKTILSYFAQASTDQGPFRDLPPQHSAGGWQGVPDFGYGEYQGIAAAGYGTAAPVDFQGELEAAWDIIAGHGISAEEYDAISTFDKQIVLDHARAYVRSGGRDSYAAEEMVNATFAGLPSEALDDVFDVPLSTTTVDRVEVLRDGFSRAFPFYDIVDQPIYELLQTTISEIERASGIPVTAERLAEGLNAFRNVGFTSYRPDILVSVLTNVCAKFANADDLVIGVLSSDAFCSPERIQNTQSMFGNAAAQLFADFCDLTITERMVEVELNNFDIAQMLDINGSDLDEEAVKQLNGQVALNPEPRQLLNDVREAVAPEARSPIARVVVPKADSKVANQFGSVSSKDPSKIATIATIGITAVALGFLANKLRKL